MAHQYPELGISVVEQYFWFWTIIPEYLWIIKIFQILFVHLTAVKIFQVCAAVLEPDLEKSLQDRTMAVDSVTVVIVITLWSFSSPDFVDISYKGKRLRWLNIWCWSTVLTLSSAILLHCMEIWHHHIKNYLYIYIYKYIYILSCNKQAVGLKDYWAQA